MEKRKPSSSAVTEIITITDSDDEDTIIPVLTKSPNQSPSDDSTLPKLKVENDHASVMLPSTNKVIEPNLPLPQHMDTVGNIRKRRENAKKTEATASKQIKRSSTQQPPSGQFFEDASVLFRQRVAQFCKTIYTAAWERLHEKYENDLPAFLRVEAQLEKAMRTVEENNSLNWIQKINLLAEALDYRRFQKYQEDIIKKHIKRNQAKEKNRKTVEKQRKEKMKEKQKEKKKPQQTRKEKQKIEPQQCKEKKVESKGRKMQLTHTHQTSPVVCGVFSNASRRLETHYQEPSAPNPRDNFHSRVSVFSDEDTASQRVPNGQRSSCMAMMEAQHGLEWDPEETSVDLAALMESSQNADDRLD